MRELITVRKKVVRVYKCQFINIHFFAFSFLQKDYTTKSRSW